MTCHKLLTSLWMSVLWSLFTLDLTNHRFGGGIVGYKNAFLVKLVCSTVSFRRILGMGNTMTCLLYSLLFSSLQLNILYFCTAWLQHLPSLSKCHLLVYIKSKFCSVWVAQLVGVSSHAQRGFRFHPWLGHLWEATNQCTPPPSSLPKNQQTPLGEN